MAQFKLTNNPFRREKNAEHIDFDEIYSLFAEPPDYDKYLQPGHCVLIGSTGSGKSAVLKALSLPVQLKRNRLENLSFYGVYIGFKNPELKHFVRLYEDYNDYATFEHFFSVKAVLELLIQLKDTILKHDYEILRSLPHLINEEYNLNMKDINVNSAIERLEEVIRIIRNNIINNRLIRDFSGELNMKVLNLDMFIYMIERINSQVLAKIGKQKICLLVDKYDYLKELCQVLNIFVDQNLKKSCILNLQREIFQNFLIQIFLGGELTLQET